MWMSCPPSARLNEGFEDKGSEYAQEGTLAHRLRELRLRSIYEGIDVTAELEEVRADPMYSASMEEYIDDYVTFIGERMAEAKTKCPDPRLFIEQRVELGEYIPESFGTSDAIILADGLMESLGPLGFCLVSALTLAVAWVLIEWPGRDRHRR